MTVDRCYLDMDGVICSFVRQVLRAHGLEYKDIFSERKKYPWQLETLFPYKISKNDFWAPTRNSHFWASMEPTEQAEDIVDILTHHFGIGKVHILSTPTMDPSCMVGKVEWIKKHFPQFSRKYAFSCRKDIFSNPRALLVDDKQSTIEKFQAGGNGFLVARPWNDSFEREEFIVEDLEDFLGTL